MGGTKIISIELSLVRFGRETETNKRKKIHLHYKKINSLEIGDFRGFYLTDTASTSTTLSVAELEELLATSVLSSPWRNLT